MVKFRVLSRIAAGVVLVVAMVAGASPASAADPGIDWTIRASAADNHWNSVTYGNGLFVAVSYTGSGNRVMTSPDGITWTIGVSAADNDWLSVTYGNGLFVAVADTGTNDRVMTSPDGITWTSRTNPVDNGWLSVIYGNGLFVAVAFTGTGNRVMTSGVLNTTTSSSGSGVPVFSLSFDSMPGVLVSGAVGSWVSLPTPTNPPAMNPNSTFLGWATYEEFPVAIAQRQIDKGWGAYEVFRDDGSMRGVFIPVEGSACIAAPGVMYPIWSDNNA